MALITQMTLIIITLIILITLITLITQNNPNNPNSADRLRSNESIHTCYIDIKKQDMLTDRKEENVCASECV